MWPDRVSNSGPLALESDELQTELRVLAPKRCTWNGKDNVDLDHTAPVRSSLIWSRGCKTFFMLNSAEHEILNAHKYKNIKEFSIFRFR